MKSTQLLYIISLCFALAACSNPREKIISKETIKADYTNLRENSELSGKQDSILQELLDLSKGRDQYIAARELNKEVANLIVDKDAYDKVVDELFEQFQSNQMTYGYLLSEIDSFYQDQNTIKSRLDSLYKVVDGKCRAIQQEIDSTSQVLNKLIDFRLKNIKKGTYRYRDYIGVTISASNKSGRTIEAVSFNLKIFDKLNEEIVTLICTSSMRFKESTSLYYEYEEHDYDRKEIYKALEQTSMRRVGKTEQSIRKVNLEGEIYGNDQINFEYETPKTLFGYCPYFDENNDLLAEIKSIQNNSEKIIDGYMALKLIQETPKSLLDMDNLKKSFIDALK